MRHFLLLGCILALVGGGCWSKPPAPPASLPPAAPTLRLNHPQNGSLVDADHVTVIGESDATAVFVNGKETKPENGAFAGNVTLKTGDNVIQVDAVNAYGTSTAVILVKRPAPKTGTGTRPRTTPPPAPSPPTAPTPSPTANVTFVSGELKLSIVLSPYGADLSWTKAANRDIRGYALVKSTTDTNPYYPKQFYFKFVNDYDTPVWTDRTLEAGKRTYYRVCTIGLDDSIRCGGVVSTLKP